MIIQHVEPELNASENIAVVASSPRLLTTEYGEFIDSFDDVVRFNRAPTDGYEKHVGAKTTIRVANNHVFGIPKQLKGTDTFCKYGYLYNITLFSFLKI